MARALKYLIPALICAVATTGRAQTPAQTPEKLAPLPVENRPKVQVEMDPKQGVVTGDLVHLRITAEAAKGDDVAVPEQKLGAFEVRAKRSRTEPAPGDRQRFRFEIDLLALEPGEHEVPPVELRVVTAAGVVGSVSTQPLKIRVSSLLGNQPNAKPRPPTKPVSVTQEDYTLLYVLGGILGAATVALLTLLGARWWQRREKKPPPPPPPRPPWETANERLAQLEREMPEMLQKAAGAEFAENIHAPDKPAAEAPLGASAPAGPARSVLPVHDESDRGRKPFPADGSAAAVSGEKLGREKMQFVDRVSDVLREYLGARFAAGLLLCDGLETTSNEMIQILREARVGTELLREIAEFLFRCDLVKFAKVVPDQKQVEAILAKAREVVQVSTPPPAPANPNPENRAESPRDKP